MAHPIQRTYQAGEAVTQQEWEQQDTEFRARYLNSLSEAEDVEPDELWERLPYWLRRHITYFIKGDSQ